MNVLQRMTRAWLHACFPKSVTHHLPERGLRHLEESAELAQALGVDRAQAHRLIDYVFDRPVGVPAQEIGGCALTLAAVAIALDEDVETCWSTELERVIPRIEQTREKQRFKASAGIVAEEVVQ